MADDTIRERAVALAFEAAGLREDQFGYVTLDQATTDVLAAADRFAAWLALPDPTVTTQLVLKVGPVTEQT
jgi:hypothetical protein